MTMAFDVVAGWPAFGVRPKALGRVMRRSVDAPAPPLAHLDRALAGDRDALRALLKSLAPLIQSRVARSLLRRSAASRRDPRQDLMDMTNEVFVSLLENDARVLRRWEKERGLSFENYVGLVADRQVASIMRTGRRSPWHEEATDDEALEHHAGSAESDAMTVVSRDLLTLVVDRLREELSPRMLHIFYALWVDETPVATVCEELGMQANALYVARSRIAKRARELAEELSGGAP